MEDEVGQFPKTGTKVSIGYGIFQTELKQKDAVKSSLESQGSLQLTGITGRLTQPYFSPNPVPEAE